MSNIASILEESILNIRKPQPHAKHKYSIKNVVYTVKLKERQNLDKPVKNLRNAKRGEPQFSSCILKFREPKSTCLIFAQGSITCVGNRGPNAGMYVLYKARRMIQSCGNKMTFVNIWIKNIVVTSSHGRFINIAKLHAANQNNTTYSTSFPGCSVKNLGKFRHIKKKKGNGPKMVVFESGKFNMVGLNHLEDIDDFCGSCLMFCRPYYGNPRKTRKNIIQQRRREMEKYKRKYGKINTANYIDRSGDRKKKKQKNNNVVVH